MLPAHMARIVSDATLGSIFNHHHAVRRSAVRQTQVPATRCTGILTLKHA